MSISTRQLAAIRGALGRLRNSKDAVISGRVSADTIFELFTMSQVAAVFGGRRFLDSAGKPTNFLVYRGKPGFLSPPRNGNRYAPGSIVVTRNGTDYSIHNGVRWLGRSGADHEADVSVVETSDLAGHYQCGAAVSVPVRLVIECKQWSGALGPGVARGFLGYAADIRPIVQLLVTNQDRENQIGAYLAEMWKPCSFLCVANGEVTFPGYFYQVDDPRGAGALRLVQALRRLLPILF